MPLRLDKCTVWATLVAELPVEVLEEVLGRSNGQSLPTHEVGGASSTEMRAWRRFVTRSRNSRGTSRRSVTMLASKTASCSAGVIAISSAAVHTLPAMQAW